MNYFIFFLLGISQVFSWDIGILYNDKIELYTKQKINRTISDTIAFQNIYILSPSYKKDSFSFFNSRDNYSFLFTYRPEYNRFDFDGKVEKEGSIQSMDIDVDKNLLFWLDINKGGLFKLKLKLDQKDMGGTLLTYFENKIVRDIVVNDINETIYWIASNLTHSFLIRTNYIGFEQDILVTQKGPMSFLAIDKEEGFLYWVHDVRDSYDIEKYNINTGKIQVVKKNLQNQACHLKISKKYLFWMDWKTRYIWKAEKNNDFMETYLSFADNAVSFVINEDAIDNENKNDIINENVIIAIENVVKDIIKTSEKIDKDRIANEDSAVDKLNENQTEKCFEALREDDEFKNVLFWFVTSLMLFTLLAFSLTLFILNKVNVNEFSGLLNTHPLNYTEI